MSKNIRPDPLGIHVTTYAELEKIVHGFARGDLKLLILLGRHGLGKSRAPICIRRVQTAPFLGFDRPAYDQFCPHPA